MRAVTVPVTADLNAVADPDTVGLFGRISARELPTVGATLRGDVGAYMASVERGDIVPHFEVRTLTGERFDYTVIWQRRHLVLARVPATAPAGNYADALRQRAADFDARDSVVIVTHDAGPDLPCPAVLVADRWGEVVHVVAPAGIDGMPAPQELIEWVEHLGNRCPECEGEVR